MSGSLQEPAGGHDVASPQLSAATYSPAPFPLPPYLRRYVVVHFYHPEFVSCAVMDKHLRVLAARAPGTMFLKINADKAPFFVGKLKVKVLPSLVFFVDGACAGLCPRGGRMGQLPHSSVVWYLL